MSLSDQDAARENSSLARGCVTVRSPDNHNVVVQEGVQPFNHHSNTAMLHPEQDIQQHLECDIVIEERLLRECASHVQINHESKSQSWDMICGKWLL